MNVKTLPGFMKQPTTVPNEQLIQILETLSTLAKDGRLQSFIGMGFTVSGDRVTVNTPHHNVYEMVGSIEWLKKDYMDMYGEGNNFRD